MRKDLRLCSALFCGASLWAVSVSVEAQTAGAVVQSKTMPSEETANRSNDSDDIVVTATKREQSLSDVGLSVSAIGQEALSNQRIANVADLAQVVPGLTLDRKSTRLNSSH